MLLFATIQQYQPNEFYFVHTSRFLNPNVLPARRCVRATHPDLQPMINASPLADASAILNGALSNITPSHSERESNLQETPYTYMIPLEAVLPQVVSGCSNDIQVALDLSLPQGTVIVGPMEEIKKLKRNPMDKLSELYPNVRFMGVSNFKELTQDQLTAYIKEVCAKGKRYFAHLESGLTRANADGQDAAMGDVETKQLFCYRLRNSGQSFDIQFYAQNPFGFLQMSKTMANPMFPNVKTIQLEKDGKKTSVDEHDLIGQLLNKTPQTDFETLHQRYEGHLHSLRELFTDPRTYRLFTNTAFEGLEIAQSSQGEEKPIRGKISQAYMNRIKYDLNLLKEKLSSFKVGEIQTKRYDEFFNHQDQNIELITHWEFIEHFKMRTIIHSLNKYLISSDYPRSDAAKIITGGIRSCSHPRMDLMIPLTSMWWCDKNTGKPSIDAKTIEELINCYKTQKSPLSQEAIERILQQDPQLSFYVQHAQRCGKQVGL